MGHASQVALGIALEKPGLRVWCLDGDGAVIMHMGSLAIIGSRAPGNFKHIVINNGAHDSVGGQPTASFSVDLTAVARACGYKTALKAHTRKGVEENMDLLKASNEASFLEIRVRGGARDDLGRPTVTPLANRDDFMDFLRR
jgi:phosphonopyruvate decarboxylase